MEADYCYERFAVDFIHTLDAGMLCIGVVLNNTQRIYPEKRLLHLPGQDDCIFDCLR